MGQELGLARGDSDGDRAGERLGKERKGAIGGEAGRHPGHEFVVVARSIGGEGDDARVEGERRFRQERGEEVAAAIEAGE